MRRCLESETIFDGLEPRSEYSVRVCPIRLFQDGEIPGAYSPSKTFWTPSNEPQLTIESKKSSSSQVKLTFYPYDKVNSFFHWLIYLNFLYSFTYLDGEQDAKILNWSAPCPDPHFGFYWDRNLDCFCYEPSWCEMSLILMLLFCPKRIWRKQALLLLGSLRKQTKKSTCNRRQHNFQLYAHNRLSGLSSGISISFKSWFTHQP